MRITNLHLENFRGFEKLDLTFPENANVVVLIGENGSGKTSVLDAILVNLSIFVEKFNYELSDDDVNIRVKDTDFFENDLKNKITVEENTFFSFDYPKVPEYFFSWSTEKKLGQTGASLKINDKIPNPDDSIFTPKEEYWQKFFIFNHFKLRQDIDDVNKTFQKFSLWFEKEANLENQIRLKKDINFREPILEFLRTTIQTYFTHLDENIHFSNLNIETERVTLNKDIINLESSHIESYLKIDKNGENLKLSQLSSGEKCILLLIFELTQGIIALNQKLININYQQGIVLIDEIDLHLHPKWQRNILPALSKTFPNVQFIVTTHSPQVLSNIPKECVFLLENNQLSDKEVFTEGRDSNSILQDAFGVSEMPENYKSELKAIYELIDAGNAAEAQAKLAKLIEKRGENDREVVRMQSYIDFL